MEPVELASGGTQQRRRRRPRVLDRGLAAYLLRRLGQGLLVIALVTITVFLVTRVASDPVQGMLPFDATPAQYAALERSIGLDKPVLEQLWLFMRDAALLDLGQSYWQDSSVAALIAERLPNTAILVGAGMLIAIAVGIPLGIVAALRPGSALDQGISSVALLGLSLPQFWLGAMLIFFFAVQLGWLPTSGRGGIDHLVLPAIAFALPVMGRLAQMTRMTMIGELATQHVLVARAKGLSTRYVITRHALRNVMVPIVTLISYETAYGLAGYAVIVETVFSWPGIGLLAIQGIQRHDLALVQGIVITMAAIVVVANLLTDVVYKVIDPRIEY